MNSTRSAFTLLFLTLRDLVIVSIAVLISGILILTIFAYCDHFHQHETLSLPIWKAPSAGWQLIYERDFYRDVAFVFFQTIAVFVVLFTIRLLRNQRYFIDSTLTEVGKSWGKATHSINKVLEEFGRLDGAHAQDRPISNLHYQDDDDAIRELIKIAALECGNLSTICGLYNSILLRLGIQSNLYFLANQAKDCSHALTAASPKRTIGTMKVALEASRPLFSTLKATSPSIKRTN